MLDAGCDPRLPECDSVGCCVRQGESVRASFGRAALLREPITIQRGLCDFGLGSAGSARPIGDHLREYRRMCASFVPIKSERIVVR